MMCIMISVKDEMPIKAKGQDPVISRVMAERDQDFSTRKTLFYEIEKLLGRPVVTYFTSFNYPVGLDDGDVDMLEGLLQAMDLSNGLALIISSLGGDGVAAERMINICKCYSKTNDFWAIIPGKAKSAATMVCLGAAKIYMGAASELGPVDPQIVILDEKNIPRYISVFHVVDSYSELFRKAIQEKDGKIEPYLQQLSKYDASIISHYNSLIELAEDISIKALKKGMMKDVDEAQIKDQIKIFLKPQKTKIHGRPIFRDDAKTAGLIIENIDTNERLGKLIYELYIRSRFYADRQVAKLIESKENSAYVQPPKA